MAVELRLRNKISQSELEQKVGKILTPDDVSVVVRRETRLLKPDGKLLLHYLPGAFSPERMAEFYETLHSLKSYETTNRGLASGTERTAGFAGGKRTYSQSVPSAIIGAFDAKPPKQYCRLTAWTGRENEQFRSLYPLFQDIGAEFKRHVPDRFVAQMDYVARTPEEWVIEGTPFSTITVNNTYPTGVHTDKGDLDEGFSTLTVLRRGDYTGGWLTFPEYRVAVDMQDGDLLLMDAHEWHGNTAMTLLDPPCDMCDLPATAWLNLTRRGKSLTVDRPYCEVHAMAVMTSPSVEAYAETPVVPAERISVVSYYRTRMAQCGTAEEEAQRQEAWAEKRIGIGINAVEEMAEEAAAVAAG